MSQENKYELRSAEVQGVLSSRPRAIIMYGNTILLLLVLAGFFFLNRIKIPSYKLLPVQVKLVKDNTIKGAALKIIPLTKWPENIDTFQNAAISFFNSDYAVQIKIENKSSLDNSFTASLLDQADSSYSLFKNRDFLYGELKIETSTGGVFR